MSKENEGKPAREVVDIDRVIHEPARLALVSILATVKEADFLYLRRETGLTKGNLSSHLSKLEEAGYVEIEKTYKGKLPLTICRLSEAGEKAFETYRAQMRRLMEGG